MNGGVSKNCHPKTSLRLCNRKSEINQSPTEWLFWKDSLPRRQSYFTKYCILWLAVQQSPNNNFFIPSYPIPHDLLLQYYCLLIYTHSVLTYLWYTPNLLSTYDWRWSTYLLGWLKLKWRKMNGNVKSQRWRKCECLGPSLIIRRHVVVTTITTLPLPAPLTSF